ncbi:uncharacterized protein TRUGW13939_04114 [Talaromyces rugulosus]|uniref:F-box domain-containing protein n=1 Tax=Talaromyces rugulosus TaxID=121627 RepID=A0A7H8QT87_TALRU|nr:uncharacterized protein TRUGW13939_04114 [Talaromyces rugulosus]QKX57006.1 hypothetical protein TRUGW13939_04114 [Talaromyces rugulosus]
MLDRLPNELIYLILAQLSSDPPPSYAQLNAPPSLDIARASASPLKNLVRVSSHYAELVRPLLFAHCRCNLARIGDFLSFVARFSLQQQITSIVVIALSSDDNPDDVKGSDDTWWCHLLREINPSRLTLLAPPTVIGQAVATNVMNGHNWAFDISFQTLCLEQDTQSAQDTSPWPTLLHTRPWKSICFNESSSLKAYNHYEYFRHRVPSIFEAWGNSPRVLTQGTILQGGLANVTHFRYTAVFPFNNHIWTVLRAVRALMPSLKSLSAQLAPDRNNRVLETELRGSMDPNDPWMELSTGFSLMAKVVRELGEKGPLEHFQVCDYDIEALRSNLSAVIGAELAPSQWKHDGYGTWIKTLRIDDKNP